MLLVIDVGNTNTVFGIYDEDKLLHIFRMTTQQKSTSDEICLFIHKMFEMEGLDKDDIRDVVIASVVPQIMYSLEHAIRKFFDMRPIVIDSNCDFGIRVLIDNPAQLGADRLVNAFAAKELFGGPAILIDFGTATTFCAVSTDGDYVGGAIAPGVKISVEALYKNTAKLPRIELIHHDNVIGKNTIASMQTGVLFGYCGSVEYITNRMKKELGGNAMVIATGGLARMIAKETDCIDKICPTLTLDGLKLYYDKTKGERA